MAGIVMPCVGVAVKAQGNGVLGRIITARAFGDYVMDFNLYAGVPVAYTAVPCGRYQGFFADLAWETHYLPGDSATRRSNSRRCSLHRAVAISKTAQAAALCEPNRCLNRPSGSAKPSDPLGFSELPPHSGHRARGDRLA